MKVLGAVFSFNDADVIDQAIEAISQQLRPVDEILLVDNASTDGTPDHPILKNVTVLRQPGNLGASGAVCSAFQYGLEHGYDWVWVFDADAAPHSDALKELLDVYEEIPAADKNEIGFIACIGHNVSDGAPTYTGKFTKHGLRRMKPKTGQRYFPCNVIIWSGGLYRLDAIRQVGLPNTDYFADWGEVEYGYRIMRAGYKGLACQDADFRHNIRGYETVRLESKEGAAPGRAKLVAPPLRCYYASRNGFYFPLYEVAETRLWMVCRMTLLLAMTTVKLSIRPIAQAAQIRALYRGLWHGLTGNIRARY